MAKANLSAFVFASALILLFGCVSQTSSKSQFPVPPTAASLVASGLDEHGCPTADGYAWCAEKSKCVRASYELCTASERAQKALSYCSGEGVVQVSVCGASIRVVTNSNGGGSIFYSDSGSETRCMLDQPAYTGDACRQLLSNSGCREDVLCVRSQPGA